MPVPIQLMPCRCQHYYVRPVHNTIVFHFQVFWSYLGTRSLHAHVLVRSVVPVGFHHATCAVHCMLIGQLPQHHVQRSKALRVSHPRCSSSSRFAEDVGSVMSASATFTAPPHGSWFSDTSTTSASPTSCSEFRVPRPRCGHGATVKNKLHA